MAAMDPFTTEARLIVLETLAVQGTIRQLVLQHGVGAVAAVEKMRTEVWDLFSQMDLNKLPPEQAKQLEAELRSAWDRHLVVVRELLRRALQGAAG